MSRRLLVDGPDKPNLGTSAAAEYLDSKESTLRTWRYLRKGPAYFRGLSRKILYRRSDLDVFIESRRIVPEATPARRPGVGTADHPGDASEGEHAFSRA